MAPRSRRNVTSPRVSVPKLLNPLYLFQPGLVSVYTSKLLR